MSTQNDLIRFYYPAGRIGLSNRTALKKFLHHMFKREAQPYASINFVFCSNPDLLALNKEYLQHDYYTDILTFTLNKKNDPLEADIYISPAMVKHNAGLFKTPFHSELHRVIFHGVLHLCGFNDKTPGQQRNMRSKEDEYLRMYFKTVPRRTVSM